MKKSILIAFILLNLNAYTQTDKMSEFCNTLTRLKAINMVLVEKKTIFHM